MSPVTMNLQDYEIYKEYMVYNYSESLSIDVSQLLQDESLTTDDVAVLVNDGEKTKKMEDKPGWNHSYAEG